jgi:putative peptide zinc metalloprotease protein
MTTTATVTGASRVRLFPLQMRPEGEQWYVGRADTGEFVALPGIAVDALRLLEREHAIDEVAATLRATQGRDLDLVGFVGNLLDLGFVAAVDGQPVDGPAPIRPTWPWLRPRHTRWTQSRVTAAITLALPVAALAVLAARPGLVPTYHDLLWSTDTSIILAGNAAVAWTIIMLHELAHLCTARAAGVPGKIGFGTRLQFLAVQTDVTGVWAQPRPVRLTVYLAGIAVNLAVSAVAILLRLVVDTPVLGAIALISALFVPTQLLLFMRTDVYFVVQDLARCGNLYADGTSYARHLLLRKGPDPSVSLPRSERRAVRVYAPVLVVGTVLCLTFAALVSVPTAVSVLARAVEHVTGREPGRRLDGALTLLITGGFWAIWCRTWWRRHGPRVTGWLTRRRSGPEGR